MWFKAKQKDRWCKHLESAGLKMFPPIIVTPGYEGTSTLTKLFHYPNIGKSRNGRKRPKADDYKDSEIPALKTIDNL